MGSPWRLLALDKLKDQVSGHQKSWKKRCANYNSTTLWLESHPHCFISHPCTLWTYHQKLAPAQSSDQICISLKRWYIYIYMDMDICVCICVCVCVCVCVYAQDGYIRVRSFFWTSLTIFVWDLIILGSQFFSNVYWIHFKKSGMLRFMGSQSRTRLSDWSDLIWSDRENTPYTWYMTIWLCPQYYLTV